MARQMAVMAAVMLVGAAMAGAQQPAPGGRQQDMTVGVIWENDSAAWKPNHNTDRFYTNGLALFLAGRPDFVQKLDLLPWDTDADHYALGLNFGQQMFTPGDITVATPQADDHPWAGYLWAGAYYQRQKNDVAGDIDTLDHLQLDLGVVGPSSLADRTQRWFHEVNGGDDPRGWKNQIHDEFTAQLYYRKKWRITHASVADYLDLIPSAGLAVGSVHRNIEGNLTLRAGYNLTDDFGPARIGDLGAATGDRLGHGVSAFGFVRAGGRAVEHNIFIEGNNFKDSPGVPAENLVGELQLGVVLALSFEGFVIEGGYSQTFITPEFDQQDSSHSFGAWTLTAHVAF